MLGNVNYFSLQLEEKTKNTHIYKYIHLSLYMHEETMKDKN